MHNSRLKKGPDPLEPPQKPDEFEGSERVRPLFRQAANTAQIENEAQVGLCFLLARLWGREVDAELLKSLRSDRFSETFSGLAEPVDQILLDDLAADYCRIMIGPRGYAAPIQSVWAEERLNGEAAGQMNRIFEVVRIPELLVPEMPDHFANQLQVFGAILAHNISNDEPATEFASCFFDRHLSWASPMVAKARSIAKTGFYRDAIEMTQWWLKNFESLIGNESKK